MTSEIILLIIGAILGAILGMLLPFSMQWLKLKRIEKRRNERNKYLANDRLTDWLIKYHAHFEDKNDVANALCIAEIGSYREKIPFLSKDEWSPQGRLDDLIEIDIETDPILRYHESGDKFFDTDEVLIESRQKLGQKLWNAPTIYLDDISIESDHVVLHVKKCNYFAVATNMIRLENETIQGVKENSFKKCSIRRKHYLELNNIERNLYTPLTLGCMVVFAMKASDGYEIIMQTRSTQNMTSTGVTSVVPDFGLSPFVGSSNHILKKRGLVYYNFLKEYLEELHGMDELIEEFRRKKTDEQYYQWLYNKAEAKQLWQNTNFHLYYLGFGFNLINGIPNMGLLAKLDDKSDTEALREAFITNWEIAEPGNTTNYEPTIWSINHKSQQLEKMFVKKQLPPNLSFFLSKALKYLD